MVRRMLMILALTLFLLPAAALADVQVVDEAGVIDAITEREIATAIEAIEQEHQVDLVVLVTYDVPLDYSDDLWRVQDYADTWYENGGYGMGSDHSGMLYMIDMNNRVQWISTEGVMIGYIDDGREERLLNMAEPRLRRENWGGAALAVMLEISNMMDEGRRKGSFLYDEETGERLSGLYNPLEGYEMLLAAGGGVLTAAIFIGSISGSYGLKGGTYSYDLSDKASCRFLKDEERYIRESVSRMARSTGGNGTGSGHRSGGSRGSGVHRSSGGRSHGGGGRRF